MWILFAVGASLFWGITYVINEHLYKHISVFSALAITFLLSGVAMAVVAFFSETLLKDIDTLFSSNKAMTLMLAGTLMLTLAEIFIGFSIANKNATIAAVVEISYPLFVALFSFLLFKDNQVNLATAIGAIFILIGIGIVYLFNK